MGKSSGGGGGDSVVKVRYAQYIEEHHAGILDVYRDYVVNELTLSNPFGEIPWVDVVDDGMLGSYKGAQLSDYPSIYALMGDHVNDLDIKKLFEDIMERTLESPTIDSQVASHSDLLDDDINENTLPRYATGMRDMNSVVSSTYVIGKALIETAKVKAVSRYDSELRVKLYNIVVQRWQSELDWRVKIVPTYLEMFKTYLASTIESRNTNEENIVKRMLWKYTVLDYWRIAVGTLQGATNSSTDVKGASQFSKAAGGALSGAAAGFMTGTGPIGGAIGGALGLASSFF